MDRVPIVSTPGLIVPWVGSDLPLGDLGRSVVVRRVFLRRTDHAAGDVVTVDVRNATGGGGEGVTVTLPDGVGEVSVDVELAGQTLYLRPTASGNSSMNLGGWFEVAESGDTGGALVDLATVKAWLKKTNATDDAVLSRIISGESRRIQKWIRRGILTTVISAEVHSLRRADSRLVLDRRPIQSVAEVRELGEVIAANEYAVATAAGMIHRHAADESFTPAAFALGDRHLEVDYTAGYVEVPADLALATTIQAAYTWHQSAPGDGRLGLRGDVLEPGGNAQYLSGPWAPQVERILHPWRSVEV